MHACMHTYIHTCLHVHIHIHVYVSVSRYSLYYPLPQRNRGELAVLLLRILVQRKRKVSRLGSATTQSCFGLEPRASLWERRVLSLCEQRQNLSRDASFENDYGENCKEYCNARATVKTTTRMIRRIIRRGRRRETRRTVIRRRRRRRGERRIIMRRGNHQKARCGNLPFPCSGSLWAARQALGLHLGSAV